MFAVLELQPHEQRALRRGQGSLLLRPVADFTAAPFGAKGERAWSVEIGDFIELLDLATGPLDALSEQDILAEGLSIAAVAEALDLYPWPATPGHPTLVRLGVTAWQGHPTLHSARRLLWNHTYGAGAWEANPFLWFQRYRRAPAARHAESRNRGLETSYGESTELVGPGGEVLYSGPLSSRTATTEERFCAVCGNWIACRSIVQHICCKFCHASWTTGSVDLREVRRIVVPRAMRDAGLIARPSRIDIHPEVGAVARFDDATVARVHPSLADLCAAHHLNLELVEKLEQPPCT